MRGRKRIFVPSLLLLLISFSCTKKKEPRTITTAEIAFEKSKDSVLIWEYIKADSLFTKKDFSSSLKIALDVLEKANEQKKPRLILETKSLIGRIWYESKSYEKSMPYFKSILNELKGKYYANAFLEGNYIDSLEYHLYVENNYNLGKLYHRLFEKKYYKEEEELKYKDSARAFYYRVINAKPLNKEINLIKAKVYNNLSGIYMRDSLFSKTAEEYAIKSLNMKKRYGNKDPRMIALGYNALSNVFFYRKEYKKSKEALLKALEALEKMQGEKYDEIRRDLYINLAYSLYKLKNHKTYEYQELAWNISDDLKDKYNERKLAEIYSNKNYEIGMKEGILQEELKLLKEKEKTWVIMIVSILVIILLIGAMIYYRFRQKTLKLTLSRNQLMQQQQIEKINSEAKIKVLNATIDGEESERKRISEELHDSILGRLFGARIGLGFLELKIKRPLRLEYQSFLEELQFIEKEIRDISHKLNSSATQTEISFDNVINQLLKEKSFLGKFTFKLKVSEEISWETINEIVKVNVYRVIQEGLQNIIKHSQAKKVLLKFTKKKGDILIVQLEDDGIGFSSENNKEGIGIKNMKSRVKKLNGKFNINSEIGKGTFIYIKIPLTI